MTKFPEDFDRKKRQKKYQRIERMLKDLLEYIETNQTYDIALVGAYSEIFSTYGTLTLDQMQRLEKIYNDMIGVLHDEG